MVLDEHFERRDPNLFPHSEVVPPRLVVCPQCLSDPFVAVIVAAEGNPTVAFGDGVNGFIMPFADSWLLVRLIG
jgi:hypothetical protein